MWASFVPKGTLDAPRPRHVVVSCGTKKLERDWFDRVRNHYELECWIKPEKVLAPVQLLRRTMTRSCLVEALERSHDVAERLATVADPTDGTWQVRVTKLTLWADIDDQEHTFISTASAPSPRSDKKLVSSFQQTSPTTSWECEGFDY